MSWGFSRQQQQQAPQFILLHSLAWLCEGSTREYRVPLSYTSQYFRLTSICLRLTRSSLSLWSGKKGVGGIDVIKYALRHGWIWDWLKVQLFFSPRKSLMSSLETLIITFFSLWTTLSATFIFSSDPVVLIVTYWDAHRYRDERKYLNTTVII